MIRFLRNLAFLCMCASFLSLCGCGSSSPSAASTAPPATPRIAQINPSSVTVGSSAPLLTVTGTGFDSSAIIRIGSTPLSTTFISATSLSTTIPASFLQAIATLSITVANSNSAGSTVSSAVNFLVLGSSVPQIVSISPASVFAGSGSFLLTVTGTGFDTTSVIGIGSTPLATTFGSSTTLSATVPASFLQTSTILFVSVTNTIPLGYVVSASANLSVLVPAGHGTIDGVVSVSPSGALGDNASSSPSLSRDGRFVAFSSRATNLTALPTGGHTHIFLRDTCRNLATGCTPQTSPISLATDGSLGNGDSDDYPTGISADGRFVVFASLATNLISGGTNSVHHIFLRDTCFGVSSGCVPSTRVLSLSTAGTLANDNSNNPSISADGRLIAFASRATNLVGGAVGPGDQIYLRDTCFGAAQSCSPSTTLVSTTPTGVPPDSSSEAPVISGNGRYIAFESLSSNLVPGALSSNIFLRDTCATVTAACTPSTILISQSPGNNLTPGVLTNSAINADGRFVAFVSFSSGLQLRDTCLGAAQPCTPSLLTLGNSVTQSAQNAQPAISADGSVVLFLSQPMIPTGITGYTGVYVAQTCASKAAGCLQSTLQLSLTATGNPEDFNSGLSALAPDGHSAAIGTGAGNLVPGGSNGKPQILSSTSTF